MKKGYAILCVVILLLVVSVTLGAEKLALTIKSRGDVSLKEAGEKSFKPNMKVGTSLYSKDHIKTGQDGFAVLAFLDDKSQIKIREYSEMVVQGKRGKNAISKRINMEFGTLKAEVSKQRQGDFIIATPTSVASVKGTVFWVFSDPLTGDVFYGLEGEVDITNNESGESITLSPDQTARSTPQGEINVKPSQQDEVPQDEDESEEGSALKSIRIEFQNDEGQIKYLVIEYE